MHTTPDKKFFVFLLKHSPRHWLLPCVSIIQLFFLPRKHKMISIWREKDSELISFKQRKNWYAHFLNQKKASKAQRNSGSNNLMPFNVYAVITVMHKNLNANGELPFFPGTFLYNSFPLSCLYIHGVDCLGRVSMYFELEYLLNVPDVNKQFRRAANYLFIFKYSQKKIEFIANRKGLYIDNI